MVFDREGVNNPTDEPTISEDTKPTMYERFRNHPGFDWAVRIIVAVIIIAIIVFGGRWLHHKLQHKTANPAPANTKQLPAAPPTSGSKRPGSSDSTSNNSASNGSNNKKSGNSSSNNQQGTATNSPSLKNGQQLADTGPGAVIAIFIAASFAAASLHYAYELRKNS